MPLRHRIGRWVARVDRVHSLATQRWYRVSPLDRPWMIVPYLGFGTARRLQVSGRVLREVKHRQPDVADSAWRNFAEFWKRMESDELPGARVRAAFREKAVETVADDEGHFSVALDLDAALEPGWHSVELELLDPTPGAGAAVRAQADVLVPASSARFGVISDIDDTIVWSDIGRKLRMLALLMRSNARMRKPFKGVAAFYRALHRGATGDERNPIFYVSSSPWNLYTPLLDFLRLQGLPRGPLMLRDFGEHLLFATSDHRAHKRRCIEQVLAAYPALPFVLIGDSGEKDPEIYSDLVHDHAAHVRTIYIRNVTADPSRIEAIDRLVAEVQRSGAQLVLAADSEFAAAHAAGEGLISVDALADVRADKRDDDRATARSRADT
jgi:phosphatidate phosphatase APP1